MEILKSKYSNFSRAYQALSDVLEVQENIRVLADRAGIHSADILEAGVIQHFEIAYEAAWKFLKEYLQEKHGIEASSPKSVFRACLTARILPEQIVNELLLLADARNTTSHIYDRIQAHIVFGSIVSHQQVLGDILQRLRGDM